MFPDRRPLAALFLLIVLLAIAAPLEPSAAQSLPGLPPAGEQAASAEPGFWQKARFEITRLQQRLQRDLGCGSGRREV